MADTEAILGKKWPIIWVREAWTNQA